MYGCERRDPELFFPTTEAGYAVAKAICNHACPLTARTSCLAIAMRHEGSRAASGRFGVYGGLSEQERTALARRLDRRRASGARITSA